MKDYFKITKIEKIGACDFCSSVGGLAKVSYRLTNNKDKRKICENCLKDLLENIIKELG